MNEYVHKSSKEIRRSYCYREYNGKLEHFDSCNHKEPNIAAWKNIDSAEFCDIKLSANFQPQDYYKVIDKVKEVACNKTTFIHFSNEPSEKLDDHSINLFWELSKRVNIGSEMCLEFEHKISSGETFYVYRNFFEKIINVYGSSKYLKLSTLDKDDSDFLYFQKNKNYIIKT